MDLCKRMGEKFVLCFKMYADTFGKACASETTLIKTLYIILYIGETDNYT